MAQAGKQGAKIRNALSGLWRWSSPGRHKLAEEWWTTAFVTALSIIVAHHFRPIGALNEVALMAIGGAAAPEEIDLAREAREEPHAVVVVTIDRPTYESAFGARAPIDRCALKSQLEQVYGIHPKPDAVVIDIDISPAFPEPAKDEEKYAGLAEAQEQYLSDCETGLYAFLLAQKPVKTALLERKAADAAPAARSARHESWQALRQAKDQITFGVGDIPITFGMTTRYQGGPDTLCAVAQRAAGLPAHCERNGRRAIDPNTYYYRVRGLPTSRIEQLGVSLREAIEDALPERTGTSRRVVFFGIGEGEIDTFQTPIGSIHGVQLHAAAFATGLQPLEDTLVETAIGIVLDLALALTVGLGIAWCWRRYFECLRDTNEARRQLALVWIVAMLAGLATVIYVALRGSAALMSHGIWFSPLPIALGMFIEGCVRGPVVAAGGLLRDGVTASDPKSRMWGLGTKGWSRVMLGIWFAVVVYGVWLEFLEQGN